MNQQDFDEFVEMLDAVAEQYGKKLSDGVRILYWQGLQDFDLPAIQQAIGRHLRNPDSGMFMPKIADIVKMLQGSTQDSALLAWSKVEKAIRMVGCDNSVAFDDPLIHRVLSDMGGWSSFRMVLEDELPFKAREFEQRYRGFKSRNENVDYPPVMIGLFESDNAAKGHRVAPPVLVGNPEVAALVMNGGTNTPALTFTQVLDPVRQLVSGEVA